MFLRPGLEAQGAQLAAQAAGRENAARASDQQEMPLPWTRGDSLLLLLVSLEIGGQSSENRSWQKLQIT
jgi:hypothetical protein